MRGADSKSPAPHFFESSRVVAVGGSRHGNKLVAVSCRDWSVRNANKPIGHATVMHKVDPLPRNDALLGFISTHRGWGRENRKSGRERLGINQHNLVKLT